jgi:3-oxoacid CoA-transferase B subunit
MDRESRRGMLALCSNYVDPRKSLVLHSEDDAIGYGPLAPPEKADRHLVNAGGQHVTALPGTAIVHHADSFALIRKAMMDVTVMGATRAGLPRRFRSAPKPA